MRGWLDDEHGVGLKDIHWFQAGANEAGRIEKVELSLPKGVKLTRVKDKSLSEMLAAGEIDCALIGGRRTASATAIRTWSGCFRISRRWRRNTSRPPGVWPIMHIIALQRRVLDENPWVARNLYNAFLASKNRSVERLMDPAVSRYPWPGCRPMRARWPSSSAAICFRSASTRTARPWSSLRYTHEQGIAHRHVKPEEIFPKGVMTSVKIWSAVALALCLPAMDRSHSPGMPAALMISRPLVDLGLVELGQKFRRELRARGELVALG